MKKIKQYLLEDLNLKDVVVIIMFSLVCLFLTLNNQGEALVAATFIMSLFYVFKNSALSLAFVIISGPFLGELVGGFFQLLVYMPFVLVSLYRSISKKRGSKADGIYVWSAFLVLFSFFMGYKTDSVTLFLQFVAMTLFYCTWKTFTAKDAPILVFAFVCCALIVCCYIFSGGLENNLYAGRLAFGENIKKLSTICAIPLAFLIYAFIGGCQIIKNQNAKIIKFIQILITLFLAVVLFLTLARGVFLAFGVGVLILLFLSERKLKTYFFFAIAAIIFVFMLQYVGSLDLFRIDRLLESEEMSTGNGRTEVWSHYINKIYDMGTQYVFFGTGPGEISRISYVEMYAHSTILDYYFSFGLFGVLTFFCVEFAVLKKLYKSDNRIPFVIAVVFLTTYATHGSAANIEMFILQGILIACVKKTNYENIRYPKLV